MILQSVSAAVCMSLYAPKASGNLAAIAGAAPCGAFRLMLQLCRKLVEPGMQRTQRA